MTTGAITRSRRPRAPRAGWWRLLDTVSVPILAIITAMLVGALVIWITSGRFSAVVQAYDGLIDGAFLKTRGLSESLVATVPYILASLAVGLGFKAGLFNIGVEGQFYIGAVSAAWVGAAFSGLPAIVHLPLAILAGAVGGAIWAAIPGFLKARTGAHEVINTIMLNYVAFRLTEYLVSGPLRSRSASAVQTATIAREAELWSLYDIPHRLTDPFNRLGVAILILALGFMVARWLFALPRFRDRFASNGRRQQVALAAGVVLGVLAFFGLSPLLNRWWPFQDQYDRLHIGLILALVAAVVVWWLLEKTTIGFELRTVGANPNAARYAGISISRSIVLAMAISGALAGIAGTIEVLGVSICRCLPLFFSSGYGFDSIAIALLAKANPFGIVPASFLFGAMRNGADLMELRSGVSKHVISLIQALVLLFVAAPIIVRWLYRIRVERRLEEEAPITRGWGG